ncbi:MAG: NADH-quinone oxidoreductase subunit C [Chloroflexi bacterium]|nr:NADH-quinone oxidoreductase subunit C [Chloroflexota bacterium]
MTPANHPHLDSLLGRFGDRLQQVTLPYPGELHFRIGREDLLGVAGHLNQDLKVPLDLILTVDQRPLGGTFELVYLFGDRLHHIYTSFTVPVPADDLVFPSLAGKIFVAGRYEREIWDMFGLVPQQHPDLRRLVRHAYWPEDYYPLRKDAGTPGDATVPDFKDEGQPFRFQRVEGEGIFEIPVGPVHAGIIEPGHFRFSVEGETIINLESRLWWVHKGIEKLFETRPLRQTVKLAERISGDTSFSHCLAYCQTLEKLAGAEVPLRAHYLRTIYAELERLYNHIHDIGFIAQDTGFMWAGAQGGRLREQLVRLNAQLTGSRSLRDVCIPGGVTRDISDVVHLALALSDWLKDFHEVLQVLRSNTVFLDRIQGTGTLFPQRAEDLQVLGYAARASGQDRDARRDHPYAAYGMLEFDVPVFEKGDVQARFEVRVEEIRQSVHLIHAALGKLPAGPLMVPLPDLPENKVAFAQVEGWRGTITHWVQSGSQNQIYRCKVKDPSFVNWPALNLAIRTNIVPDFPLTNKSFDLSYSGNDL